MLFINKIYLLLLYIAKKVQYCYETYIQTNNIVNLKSIVLICFRNIAYKKKLYGNIYC